MAEVALCNFLNFQMSEKPRSLLQLLPFCLFAVHKALRVAEKSRFIWSSAFVCQFDVLFSLGCCFSWCSSVHRCGGRIAVQFQQSLTTRYPNAFGDWMLFLRYLCIMYKFICYALAKHTVWYFIQLFYVKRHNLFIIVSLFISELIRMVTSLKY